MSILSIYFTSTKIIKIGIKSVGYTFRLNNYVKFPSTFPIVQSWRRHCVIPSCLLLVHFTPQRIRNGPFLLIVAVLLTLSRGVQPCTHANSKLCSMRYWFVPLVTGLFLACSACYWPVPGLFRLLLACSLVVPLVTDLFLACSAFYWLVPLVPCFRNVDC